MTESAEIMVPPAASGRTINVGEIWPECNASAKIIVPPPLRGDYNCKRDFARI